MDKTKIDWCDSTWNPITGCIHGCEYCYARGIADRFGSLEAIDGKRIKLINTGAAVNCVEVKEKSGTPYPEKFAPTFHRYRLEDYLNKAGRKVFVCSMGDMFGSWVPDEWIIEVLKACEIACQHTYLFLTKNPSRYFQLESEGELPVCENMWYGATATNKMQLAAAVAAVGKLGSRVKTFLSIEPLLEDITLSDDWCPDNLKYLFDWFIVGAETGTRHGKVTPQREWIEQIVKSCRRMGKPVFLKSGRGIMEEIWGKPLIQEYPW